MKNILAYGKEFEFYFKYSGFNHLVENCHMIGQRWMVDWNNEDQVRMMFLSPK